MSLYGLMGNSATIPASSLPAIPNYLLPRQEVVKRAIYVRPGAPNFVAATGQPSFALTDPTLLSYGVQPITLTLPPLGTDLEWRVKVSINALPQFQGDPDDGPIVFYWGFNFSQGTNVVGTSQYPNMALQLPYSKIPLWTIGGKNPYPVQGSFEDLLWPPDVAAAGINASLPIQLNVFWGMNNGSDRNLFADCDVNVLLKVAPCSG